MNVLLIGHGSGSWTMRGQQLGAALGARVTSAPTEADWHWAERVVLVKRAGLPYAARARALGLPVVWDALDFWRQPMDNRLPEPAARRLLQHTIDQIQPTLVVGATEAMAVAAGGSYLPHHGRLGLTPTPARETFAVVGYDGAPAYLDCWGTAIAAQCATRGWTFVVNPPDLAAVDLLVALRGGRWDGWVCREWKSGVKLVNAILAGRPVITQPSAAARELQPAGTILDSLAELPDALDFWVDPRGRRAVVDESVTRAPAFTVDAIAAQYARLLETR